MRRLRMLAMVAAVGLAIGSTVQAGDAHRAKPQPSPELQKLQQQYQKVYRQRYYLARKAQREDPALADMKAAADKARDALELAVLEKLAATPEHKELGTQAVAASKRIEQLQAQIAELQKQLAAAQEEYRELRKQVNPLRRDLIASDEKLKSLDQASRKARQALNVQTEQKLADDPEAVKLQAQLDRIKADMEALKKPRQPAEPGDDDDDEDGGQEDA